MFVRHKYLFLFLIVCSPVILKAQGGTRSNGSSLDTIGKIMIIPFDPKLYISDIDMKINQQTKWKFETIRENFRHQLDTQLKLKLQSISPVISFYSDSIKMLKDLEYVYRSTNVFYDPVNKSANSKTNEPKQQQGIKNGQVEVEINEDKKFMNTKITDNEVLPYLNKKYKAEYFVFVNELDMNNDPSSYDMASDTYQRQILVHYCIMDKTGKTIKAGLATSHFSSKINDPKKITSVYFASIANSISADLLAILKPQPKTSRKK